MFNSPNFMRYWRHLPSAGTGIFYEFSANAIDHIKHNNIVRDHGVITFSNNSFDLNAVNAFGDALAVNTTIRVLNLQELDLSNMELVNQLADGLEKNKNIQFLLLSRTGLSNAGIQRLAQTLKINNTLQGIDIIQSGLDDVGAAYLIDGLAVNNSVSELYILAPHHIGSSGPNDIHNLSIDNLNQVPVVRNKNYTENEQAFIYIMRNVIAVLGKERKRLKEKYQDENNERLATLNQVIPMISKAAQACLQLNSTPHQMKTDVKDIINTHLAKLDKYPSWSTKLGLILLNAISAMTVVAPVVKYVITGDFFFSVKGKTGDAGAKIKGNLQEYINEEKVSTPLLTR